MHPNFPHKKRIRNLLESSLNNIISKYSKKLNYKSNFDLDLVR